MTDPRIDAAEVRYFLTPGKGCSDVATASLHYAIDGKLYQVVVRRGQGYQTTLTPAEVEVLAELVRTRTAIK